MGLYPKEIYEEIVADSLTMPQYAADALQHSILAGISKYVKTTVINFPFIGSYPRRFKRLFTSFATSYEDGVEIRNFGFFNLTLLKDISRTHRSYKALRNWIRENPANRTIIIYSIHNPFLSACVRLKKEVPNLKIVQIVPDLPEYMFSKRNKVLEKINQPQNYYSHIDGWVLISKYMAEKLSIKNKPWIVIEGINNSLELLGKTIYNKSIETFRIFYGGTLNRQYGILSLVNAVKKIQYQDIELVICGDGDAFDEIKTVSQADPRIKLLGALPREDVLNYIRTSDLLVNPRTNEGEFTKFSFPSKTMEYLSSGVPTLLYKLPGIPDEYYDYCFFLEETGVNILRDEIVRIYNLPQTERLDLAQKSKSFILNKKNPLAQNKKLYNLLLKIENDK